MVVYLCGRPPSTKKVGGLITKTLLFVECLVAGACHSLLLVDL